MDEMVNVVRKSARDFSKLRRKNQRDDEKDERRRLDNRINPKAVPDIINKLKTASSITASELNCLKNAIIDDVNTTGLVMSTDGALRGLVRELTGKEATNQCAAVGCVCNLALASERTCTIIAKAAGPYLMLLLSSQCAEIAATSAWTVGNLAGAGSTVCQLLVVQGVLAKLTELLSHGTEDHVQDAMYYALMHVAYNMRDELPPEDLQTMIRKLSYMPTTADSLQVLSILSCHKDFDIPEELLHSTLSDLTACLLSRNQPESNTRGNTNHTIALAKVLGNVNINDSNFQTVLGYLSKYNLFDILKVILKEDNLMKKYFLWFLGNLFMFSKTSSLATEMYHECFKNNC